MNFKDLGIDTNGRTTGKVKLHCPKCRDTRSDKRDKALSVNLDSGLFFCHYCNWSGCAKEPEKAAVAPVKTTPSAPSTHIRQMPIAASHREWLITQRGISAEVIDAMALTSANPYMPQSGNYEPCIGFNYYEQGKLVNTKFRSMLKHFKMIQGAELIPYNIDAIAHSPQCVITEGEIDALSFITAGLREVVSVPSGANANLSWLDRFMKSHFENKQTIYIAVDTDTKGVALRKELVSRFGIQRCRIVTFGDDCKDANEYLLKHGAYHLGQLLATAQQVAVEGIYNAKDMMPDLNLLYHEGNKAGYDTGWADFDELCTFEPGRLCVVSGIPGCGKSEFVDELVMRLNLRHGWKAAFFSPENLPISYHMRKLIEKSTGQVFSAQQMTEETFRKSVNYLTENFYSILPIEDFTLENIFEKARVLIERNDIRVLVLDPFNRIDHQIPGNFTETQYIGMVLDKMSNFARRFNCLIILVAHPRKVANDPTTGRPHRLSMYDINGSAHFFNKTDFGLIVERDRDAGITRVRIEKVKFKHLGRGNGEAHFLYNTANGRYACCPQKDVTKTVNDIKNWIQ